MWWLFLGVVFALIAFFKLHNSWHWNYIKPTWALCNYTIRKSVKNNLMISIVIIIFILFLLGFLWLFFQYLLPLASSLYELMSYQIDNIRIGDDAFRNVALSIGGSITLSIAVLGLILTVIRNILVRQQNKIDEQRLVTEQISRATDQIGAYKKNSDGEMFEPSIEVRFGGLYSLQRIMQNSRRDEKAIAEILSAYVRENAKGDRIEKQKLSKDKKKNTYPLREDIQAALDITSQFNQEQIKQNRSPVPDIRLNFSRSDFSRSDFSYSIFARSVLLSKNSYFTRFHFKKFILTQIDFRFAILEGVNFSEANLDYQDFSSTLLKDANFSGADLFCVVFSDADLTRADFTNTNLLGADLSRANLLDTILTGAILSCTNLSLAGNLTQEQINEAKGDQHTKLPKNLKHPDHWEKDEDEDEEPDLGDLE